MKRAIPVLLMALALILGGCGKSEKKAVHGPGIAEAVPLGPLPRVAIPTRYRLSFVIDPAKNAFTGHDEIDVTFATPRRALFLHCQDLNVSGVFVRLPSGKTITAHYDQVDRSGVARLVFVDEVPRGPATLVFDYDAPFGRTLDGLYKVVDRGHAYAFTQFEAVSARRAFPSFDEPGFKTPFNVTVTTPVGDEVISNTEQRSVRSALGGMKRVGFATTKPLPTYLVAIAVGPFDIVDGGVIPASRVRSRPIHLRGIAPNGEGAHIRAALSLTPKIVTTLENYFGVAYPFSKLDMLAVPDFAAGAMENAGAITFRERLMLFDKNASLEQKRTSLLVQAHELTHQWFGDLVTPQWWDDIWLNESFATWMSTKAAAAVLPEQQYDTETLRSGFEVMNTDELPSARQIHQPVRTQDDISDAFDGITYNKGASVLAMFESYLGEDVWRAGIHTYLTKYAFGNATAKDFIGTIAELSNRRLHYEIRVSNSGTRTKNDASLRHALARIAAQTKDNASLNDTFSLELDDSTIERQKDFISAFNSYLNQPGVPLVHVGAKCSAIDSHLDVAQSNYAPIGQQAPSRLWGIPVCIGGGSKTCQLVSGKTASIGLTRSCTAALMPNAGGKGYYRFAFDEKGWAGLIAAAPTLSPADQITLLQNMDAALHAGGATAGDLFKLIKLLAPTARWDVIDRITAILHRLRETGVNLDDYRAFVGTNFSPRLKAVGLMMNPREPAATSLLREKLVALMVGEANDPAVVAELSATAHAYVASNGLKPGKLAPDLLGDALRAGLASDPLLADGLVTLLEASSDEAFRRAAIYAFSGSNDRVAISKLLATVPKMRLGDIRYLYQYMAAEPVARGVMWNWFKANYGALVARVSPRAVGRAVAILANVCDAGSRGALDAFFRPKTAELEGSARPLALAEERIDRCVAFEAAKGPEIAAALQSK